MPDWFCLFQQYTSDLLNGNSSNSSLSFKDKFKLYYLPATRMINWHEKKAKKSNDLCIITVPAFPTQPNEKYSTTIACNPPKSVKRRSTKISSRSQIDDFA